MVEMIAGIRVIPTAVSTISFTLRHHKLEQDVFVKHKCLSVISGA